MTWKLFIDDERFPPDAGHWKIARDLKEVMCLISIHGSPNYISFDHDLGEGVDTGYDIAKALVQSDMSKVSFRFTDDFDFYVHSQNPVGKANIECFINNYLEFKRENGERTGSIS